MTTPPSGNPPLNRRQFLRDGARVAALTGLGALFGLAAPRVARGQKYVWQIDPTRCVYCGQCATACVLKPSAVKCVQSYPICGYCDLCTGYFVPEPNALNTGAENQVCPTAAIERRFIEDPYYEYNINEDRCIGCAKCVEGCTRFGNGSFYLQVRHDRCVNCNECSIARVCAGDAFRRVPAEQPYYLKTTAHA
jgi:electron transport complex protein RnfB